MEQNEEVQSSSTTPVAPPECPHVAVCKFDREPKPARDPKKDLDEQREHFRKRASELTMEPQKRAFLAEARAIEHNRVDRGDGKGRLESADDVERYWHCGKCQKDFEVDQVLRDEGGRIVGLVEVKSGGNLRGSQADVHSVIAEQGGIQYYKKVQHKAALKKCKDNGIPHFDMTSTPELKPL